MSKTRTQKLEELYKLIWTLNPDLPMGPGMGAQFSQIVKELGDPRSRSLHTAHGKKQGQEDLIKLDIEALHNKLKKEKPHNHYFKDVSGLKQIDVYRVLSLFGVTDPCLQHAIKKLLVAGGRGAKPVGIDVKEAIDSLQRFIEMLTEDAVSQSGPVVEFKTDSSRLEGDLVTKLALNQKYGGFARGKPDAPYLPASLFKHEYYGLDGLPVEGPCEGYLIGYTKDPEGRHENYGIWFGESNDKGFSNGLVYCSRFQTTQMNMKTAITEYEKKFGAVPPRLKMKCGLLKPE